ncbi:MAG TPA: beta-propeller fold lactonase family protein [Leptospiraceae bacterium]|nr:beta-propeller fold lactonase family protein [Leptospiraceae bacterium]HMW05937.1 beta-propeller fold lactonase family protein [Leptospiraceae bacterium]HMX34551.1 beta-propeller fold lactonase family protein [Leptospiraceae bacterium]HMY32291.1 beta-propeller fold lactonase family protein [Leptospiraceae bacterium]HMZ62507.1 beta-propeller fold lactonase family protein [Leptospiraceae bacterium]
MFNRIAFFVLTIFVLDCNTHVNKSLGGIGFLSYIYRYFSSKSCITYAKTVNSTNSSGSNNSYTCNFDISRLSYDCIYTNPITVDNISTTVTTEFYNSTFDFINRVQNFTIYTMRYSQINNDSSTNKFFNYDNSMRLLNIIQSDGTTVNGVEYDSKNRVIKGNIMLSNSVCSVPFVNTYDDTNLIFSQTLQFSQTYPNTNLFCYFISTTLSDQKTEAYLDKNLFLSKRIFTYGANVTTETYTTVDTARVCTGDDGVPYSAPIIQKINLPGAAVGETVTITGANFDLDPSANTIQFVNGIATNGIASNGSSLSFVVPSGAASGQIKVVNRFGMANSKNIFYIYRYFLYTANNGSNSISSMELDSANGSFSNLVSFAAGTNPQSLVAAFNGKSLYAVNSGSTVLNNISINQTNGTLTGVNTATVGNGLKSIAIDSTGNLMFVVNSTDMTISRVLIDQNTGNVVVLGATNVGVAGLYSIVTHPSLPFVYVTANTSSKVYGYTIDFNTGNLNPMIGSPYSVSANPLGISIEPNGSFLYTANAIAGSGISRFTINQLNGSLSSELVVNANLMETITIDPSGKYLFACSLTFNTIYSYGLNSNSSPSLLNSIPSNQCRNLLIDPQGKYLFATEDVAGLSGKINVFTIQPNGNLAVNSSLSLGVNNPRGIALAKAQR